VSEDDLSSRFLALARAGDLDALIDLAYRDVEDVGDELAAGNAYKWLAVASDLGHDEADDLIDTLLTGPLHADDDNFISGHAHFELAVSYLTGGDHLPIDFDRAREHLHEMLVRGYPSSVQGGEEMLAQARTPMAPAARAVFDEVIAPPGD
jgi:hypothetical protein